MVMIQKSEVRKNICCIGLRKGRKEVQTIQRQVSVQDH